MTNHNSRVQIDELIASTMILIDTISPEDLARIQELLASSDEISVANLAHSFGISGLAYETLKNFFHHLHNGRTTLLLALQTAIAVRTKHTDDSDICELTWTAPIQFSIPGRTTMTTMREIILSAKSHITVVGYRIEEYAKPLLELLQDAIRRGLEVLLVIDGAKDPVSLLRKYWKTDDFPTIYCRPRNVKDPMEAIHAKLIIADSSDLLVTSANLTYHGLRANIEIGVRIKGKTAHLAQVLINELIRNGKLVAV